MTIRIKSILSVLAILGVGIFTTLTSCGKEDNPIVPEEEIVIDQLNLVEGALDTVTYEIDGVVVANYQTKIVNLMEGKGTEKLLYPVAHSYTFSEAKYAKLFRPVDETRLKTFVKKRWSKIYGLNGSNADDLIKAYRILINWLMTRDVDIALILDLIKSESSTEAIISMVDEGGDNLSANNLLMYMDKSQIDPVELQAVATKLNMTSRGVVDKLLKSGYNLQNLGNGGMTKSGTASKIIKIITSGKEIYDEISYLVANKGPVNNVSSTAISILDSGDKNASNYKANSTTTTGRHTFKYGITGTEFTYQVELSYNATHPSIPGKYITKAYVNPIVSKTKTGKVIVSVNYSGVGNAGTANNPEAWIACDLNIQYGDCCCVQKRAYPYYEFWGNNGIR